MGTDRKIKSDGQVHIESTNVDIDSTVDITGDVNATGDIGGATSTITGNASVGGDLTVTGDTSTTDLTASGTGSFTGNLSVSSINNLTFPSADGTNGQAIITDGSGALSFGDVASGGGGGVDEITSASDATNYSGTNKIIHITSTADVTFTANLSNRIVICENDILVTLQSTGPTLATVENLHFKSIGDFKFDAAYGLLKNLSIKCKDIYINNRDNNYSVGIMNCELFCNDITWSNVNGFNSTYILYDSNIYCQLFYPPISGGGGNADLIDIRNSKIDADILSGYIDLDSTYPSFLNARKGTDGLGRIYIDGTLYVNPNYNYPFKVDSNGVNTKIIVKAYPNVTSQSISTTNPTKITLAGTHVDNTSSFDTATNYRFTAKVKGEYLVMPKVFLNNVNTDVVFEVRTNGASANADNIYSSYVDSGSRVVNSAIVVELDVDDYLEFYSDSASDSSYSINNSLTIVSIKKIN